MRQEGGALTGKAAHADGALEAVHHGLDDIHADAAPADFGDLAGGAQTGLEDEIESVAVADAGGLLGADDALRDRLLDDHREIDAVAIIADLDDHLVALMIGVEADGSFGRFTGGSALQRRLDAVIDGVAQQVHHGLGQRVQNALVEVGILALDDDVDLAAGLFGGVTHHPGQTAEHLLDGHHANLHYGALKFSENLRLEGENVDGLGAQRTVGEAAIHLRAKFLHHAFGDDEFAHQIEHHVDAFGLDADDVFGGGGKTFFAELGTVLCLTHGLRGASLVLLPLRDAMRRLLRCGLRRLFGGSSGVRGARRRYRRGCGGLPATRRMDEVRCGALDRQGINLGDHGRNLALALDPVEFVMAGEHHLDDVRNFAGGFIGTHHQDGAGLLQDVAHQLHGSGAHGAGGIDGEREVVDVLSAHRVLGNQQLLVFGPGELRRKVGFRVRIADRLDELVDGFGRRAAEAHCDRRRADCQRNRRTP